MLLCLIRSVWRAKQEVGRGVEGDARERQISMFLPYLLLIRETL